MNKTPFLTIFPDCAAAAVAQVAPVHGADLETILEADQAARRYVREHFAR